MIFSTLAFVLFLAAVLPAYWLLRSDRWRLPLLFFANFVFYGWWDWRFTALLLFVIVVAYAGGRALARAAAGGGRAKAILLFSCGVQLAVLGYFKYADLAFFPRWVCGAKAPFDPAQGTVSVNTANDWWVAMANQNISAGGPVWPVFREFYPRP